jgi:scyllo-inositol 2-dehydrogenase (NADP+)
MKRIIAISIFAVLPLAAQEYRIAVVSLAHSHAWSHLPAMLKGDQVKLVGVADESQALLDRAKRTVPENLLYTDYRKMIDETKPDIVWAFSETYRHVEIVRYCAPRKIHVIVEKPLAAAYGQALEIQRLARQFGIQVLTNYSSTWRSGDYAAKAAIEGGEIGPVFRLRAIVGHGGPGDPKKSAFAAWLADPVKNGGGALMDFASYSVNWALWLKGIPESVYATTLHLRPEMFPDVEDSSTVILNYRDAVAIIEGSWDLPRSFADHEVLGRQGSMYIVNDRVDLRKTPQRGGRGASQPVDMKVDPLPPERAETLAYLVNRLHNNQSLDGMSALDINVQTMEVLEAAKLSIQTGRAVPLPLPRQPGNN